MPACGMRGCHRYDCVGGRRRRIARQSASVLFWALSLAGVSAARHPATGGSVVGVVQRYRKFSALAEAVAAGGLESVLAEEGPFTLFAPTNDAFEAAFEALGITKQDLLGSRAGIERLLRHHVVEGKVMSKDMVDGREVTTLTGHKLKVSISETGQLAVDDAKVVLADTEASNGVVHTIDAVLLVQTDAAELAGLGKHGNAVEFASSDRSFSTFLAAVIEANVISSLSQSEGPFTIFAPADSAIRDALVTILTNVGDSMPSAPELVRILQYHVVPYKVMSADLQDGQELQTAAGVAVRVSANAYGTVMVNDAKLIAADVKTRNGVVHVIDAILTPPARDDNFAAAKDRAPPASLYPVLFRSFVMTGLFEAFLGADSFTVFAPTEESMNAALDAMFVDMDELLASPGFANIVKHHVLPSKAFSADLKDGEELMTLSGSILKVSIGGNGVIFVDEAEVVAPDLEVGSGVVHMIDSVLMPPPRKDPPLTVVDVMLERSELTTLVAAVIQTNFAKDLAADVFLTVFAPTNWAFTRAASLRNITARDLLAKLDLGSILRCHTVPGKWFTNGLTDGQELKTFDGEILAVSVGKDATVSVNGAEVVVANLKAGNGVVHLINSVLTSPEENWRMLIGDVMAPVSNPPDDGGLSAKAADSIDSSIMGQKGEANWPAQVIDAVDSAPVAPTEEALPFSVVDVLANHSQLSTFLAASTDDPLGFYMMVETGAFTVFAPNNDAFVGFSAALNITIQELLSDPGLESIIKLHAVPGKFLSADLHNGEELKTFSEDRLSITIRDDGAVMVDDANVVISDLEAANGIVHVIDRVLFAPSRKYVPNPFQTAGPDS